MILNLILMLMLKCSLPIFFIFWKYPLSETTVSSAWPKITRLVSFRILIVIIRPQYLPGSRNQQDKCPPSPQDSVLYYWHLPGKNIQHHITCMVSQGPIHHRPCHQYMSYNLTCHPCQSYCWRSQEGTWTLQHTLYLRDSNDPLCRWTVHMRWLGHKYHYSRNQVGRFYKSAVLSRFGKILHHKAQDLDCLQGICIHEDNHVEWHLLPCQNNSNLAHTGLWEKAAHFHHSTTLGYSLDSQSRSCRN